MGMFDYIHYNGKQYQTKDTPAQLIEQYEIRGSELWFKKVEREWEENDSIFGGYLKEISHEWVFCSDFDGKINFYCEYYDSDESYQWEEHSALFMDGKIIKIKQIS